MAIEKQNGDIIEFVKQKDYIMVNNLSLIHIW